MFRLKWEYKVWAASSGIESGLNKLGKEGWELITVLLPQDYYSDENHLENVTFILKRMLD